MRRTLWLLPCLFAAAVLALVTVGVAAADPPGIKWVSAPRVNSVDGGEVYDAYCAVCHGPTGRGNGAAARFLDAPVPSLSQIADRDGSFDPRHVKNHVICRSGEQARMADWKSIFKNNYAEEGIAEVALFNVVEHLEHLQASHNPR